MIQGTDHRAGGRRRFLGVLLGSGLALLSPLRVARAFSRPGPGGPHPDPRPGITAANVIPAATLEDARVRAIFDKVREIPGVVDGIRCNCGCADLEGFYSLLSCYEGSGMARSCAICQGQGELAHRLHSEGWSLDGIRRAIDLKYGS